MLKQNSYNHQAEHELRPPTFCSFFADIQVLGCTEFQRAAPTCINLLPQGHSFVLSTPQSPFYITWL